MGKTLPIGMAMEDCRELRPEEVALIIWEDDTLSDEERVVLLRDLAPRSELN